MRGKKILIVFLTAFLIVILGYLCLKQLSSGAQEDGRNLWPLFSKTNKSISKFENKEVNSFQQGIMDKYKDIKAVEVGCSKVDLGIDYIVKSPLTTEEREKIFSETELLLHQKAFQDSIMKECNRKAFFSHITINFINDDKSYQFLCQTNEFNKSAHEAGKWITIDIGKQRKEDAAK